MTCSGAAVVNTEVTTADASDGLLAEAMEQLVDRVQRKKNAAFDELLKMPPQVGASQQLKPTQALKNPNSAVILEAIALGELSAPRIVYNGRGSELCSLDSDFGFPSVLVLNDGFGFGHRLSSAPSDVQSVTLRRRFDYSRHICR